MDFMTGNLSYQIEHHLFPDLPSNRYAEIAVRVRAAGREVRPALHDRLAAGAVLASRGAPSLKLSLPNKYLRHTADDAPETASERLFAGNTTPSIDPVTGRRQGLRTALAAGRKLARRTVG